MKIRFEQIAGGTGCTVSSFALANWIAKSSDSVVWLSSDDMIAALPAVKAQSVSSLDDRHFTHLVSDGSETDSSHDYDVTIGCIRNDYLSLKRAIGMEPLDMYFCIPTPGPLTIQDARSVLNPYPVFALEFDERVRRQVDAGLTDKVVASLDEAMEHLYEMVVDRMSAIPQEQSNTAALDLAYRTGKVGHD